METLPRENKLIELAKLFFKQGIIGFGGPAAHIAMMEEEVVNRRNWLTREHFLDLVGATNLIPGPNSTEMAIHIGYTYAQWPGLIIAGVCFIFPAVLLTGLAAWIYVSFGTLPQVAPLLYGIKPAVLAVIGAAVWRLGKTAFKKRILILIALAVVVAVFMGVNEVLALILGGIGGMVILRSISPPVAAILSPLSSTLVVNVSSSTNPPNYSLWQLGLVFLKIGCVLYGSGYVLVAFLQSELVQGLGWLTQKQLLDAIAIGQFTPGPVLSTATFIGYVIGGLPGAIVATIGIFLPSFVLVALLNPIVPKLRASKYMSAFLDAINASAIALMIAVTIQLGREILFPGNQFDWFASLIFLVSAIIIIRWRLNAAWLVFGGAIFGWVYKMFVAV
ncbi:chromate efflux transporter [Calothrix sp. NIES-3974]|uniref:chromate efflux transporter n=1 Tax=Calothrix sp. NIES-3974 TaxID=2005462 RepID=UPI000BBC9F05|nr:chromate efflux transporter [Calothrix sp. NIES-3974]